MGKSMKCRVCSAAVAASLLFTGTWVPVSAAGNVSDGEAKENLLTVAGEPETVRVGGEGLTDRENDFNDGWKFYLGTSSAAQDQNFDDSGWEDISLPHDFSISQPYTIAGEAESGFLPGGTGWYRKSFTLPEEYQGKEFKLQFDGVYSDAYVYVNGKAVGENHYGYTPFAFDITDEIVCDGRTNNVIAVKAVNNIPSSRWYSGSGIYRDVTMTVTEAVHADSSETVVTTPDIAEGKGTVKVQTSVVNDADAESEITVANTVYTKDGKKVSGTEETTLTVKAGTAAEAETTPVVDSPQLWSTDDPALYYVRTEVMTGDEVVDTMDTEFGFRYFEFDTEKGFYLNGKAVKLNGVCLHHDQGALGSAAYDDAMYRQLTIMKDMGVNAVRTSHNPADEDFIDICNELGLLVIEEAFDGWELPKNGNSNDFSRYFNAPLDAANTVLGGDSSMTWAEFAVKNMVKRDRNDPAVILWSLGNEVQEGTSTNSDFAAIATKLTKWIKEVDTTRQTTIGSNQRTVEGKYGDLHRAVKEGGGIVGFNYASADQLESMHAAYGPILASETSSAVNSRGIYTTQDSAVNADGRYHLTSYDTSAVSWGMTAHDSMWNTLTADYVAGEFVWTGFDYLGEPTPWNGTGSGSVSYAGAIPNSSYFGIAETTGFEKDTYWLYRSQWNQKENTLHLVTSWDSDNMLINGYQTPVVVYSNAPVVKLYRNGSLIGTAVRKTHTTEAGHTYYTYKTSSEAEEICTAVDASGAESLYAAFQVAYEPGTISAKAYEEDGKTEIPDIEGKAAVSTPDEIAQLNATVDKKEISADGESLAYVTVDVTDGEGNIDTTAQTAVSFKLEGNGEILGVDNGDQATTEKYQQASVLSSGSEAQINAYGGKALAIVRSTKEAGGFTVQVSAPGLKGDQISVATSGEDADSEKEGLISYTMIRDYSVKAGTKPELSAEASGRMGDGTQVSGIVEWEEIPSEIYQTAGDYTINGLLTFENVKPIQVSCRLHVIPDVIALQNISSVTTPDVVPNLPDIVKGVLIDGVQAGEFAVTWEEMKPEQFSEVGTAVTVDGTAKIIGNETLPVTASVRVAEAVNTESINVAPSVSSLTQDIEENKQSDNLQSIINGILKPGDNTSERWTNWNNRTTDAEATLTFRWDTAQMLNSVNLYYYYDSCSAYPEDIRFEYTLNGTEYQQIACTSELVESYSLGEKYTYTFEKPVNPVGLRIILTQQGGITGNNCVGLTETEIMTYAGKVEYHTSAALSGISVDGTDLENFQADAYSYEATGTGNSRITASSDVNAGITILPCDNNIVRILTVSEDGQETRTYEVNLKEAEKTKVPEATLTVEPARYGKIILTGKFEDYENAEQYYPVTAWGMVYVSTEKLGDRELTVDIPGRCCANIRGINDDGSFIYKSMATEYYSTEYCIRAYLAYTDESGNTVYRYSEPIITSYNQLTGQVG